MKKVFQLKTIIVFPILIGCSNEYSLKNKEIQKEKEEFHGKQVEKVVDIKETPDNEIDDYGFEYSDWMNSDGQNGVFILTDADLDSILNSSETTDSEAISIFDSYVT